MTEVDGLDGQSERRRGLEGTLGRIVRELKVGGGGFPRVHEYDPDDPDDQPEGPGIWLPKIDPLPGETEPPE